MEFYTAVLRPVLDPSGTVYRYDYQKDAFLREELKICDMKSGTLQDSPYAKKMAVDARGAVEQMKDVPLWKGRCHTFTLVYQDHEMHYVPFDEEPDVFYKRQTVK